MRLEPLRGRYHRSVDVVSPPGADALLETLVRPAALFGYRFEDEDLPREMVARVAQEPAALALLQFCADQLWERRQPETRSLTRAAYRALGGVEGALAAHADGLVEAMPPSERAEVRRLLVRLVTADLTRAPRPRRELLQSAPDEARAGSVLAKLVAARLVSVSEADDGEPLVELVHEALIQHWERLRGWLGEDEDTQRLLRTLGVDAREWARAGRPDDALWRGTRLTRLRELGPVDALALTPEERAFAERSDTVERRTRRARRAGYAAVMLAAAVVAGGALGLWSRAEDARQDALASAAAERLSRLSAIAQRELVSDRRPLAVRLARHVLERSRSQPGARSTLLQALAIEGAWLRLQTDGISPSPARALRSGGSTARAPRRSHPPVVTRRRHLGRVPGPCGLRRARRRAGPAHTAAQLVLDRVRGASADAER